MAAHAGRARSSEASYGHRQQRCDRMAAHAGRARSSEASYGHRQQRCDRMAAHAGPFSCFAREARIRVAMLYPSLTAAPQELERREPRCARWLERHTGAAVVARKGVRMATAALSTATMRRTAVCAVWSLFNGKLLQALFPRAVCQGGYASPAHGGAPGPRASFAPGRRACVVARATPQRRIRPAIPQASRCGPAWRTEAQPVSSMLSMS